MRNCLHENIPEEVLLHKFISGLNAQTPIGGCCSWRNVLSKNFQDVYTVMNKMSSSNLDWQGDHRQTIHEAIGAYELDPITTLTAQVSALANQISKTHVANASPQPVHRVKSKPM